MAGQTRVLDSLRDRLKTLKTDASALLLELREPDPDEEYDLEADDLRRAMQDVAKLPDAPEELALVRIDFPVRLDGGSTDMAKAIGEELERIREVLDDHPESPWTTELAEALKNFPR